MNHTPRWARLLLRWLAPRGDADDVLGDLEEVHRIRRRNHGAAAARLFTVLDTLDMSAALVRARVERLQATGGTFVHDYKLGLRMLLKYPGLTIAGGLALAIAIGIGAGWYDLSRDLFAKASQRSIAVKASSTMKWLPPSRRCSAANARSLVAAGRR